MIRPVVGLTPDAIPKAIASGNATIPTTIPEIKSALNFASEYPRNDDNDFGWKSIVPVNFMCTNLFSLKIS